ncbi:MAG: c-type cytochrome [Akkermansiaceae bacterium]|nr:c-type cytochrome [Akkermansiaceae bacterium]
MKTLSLTLLLAAPLLAQEGNRKGHNDMSPVVPENLIPPSPVLSVEDALKSFTIADGFIIEPVAYEPLVEKPVALRFDANGRIWVVEMIGYMLDLDAKDEDLPQGRIAVLEDTDGDGQVDKRTVFLDNILLPRAIALVEDGILFADQTKLYFCGRNGAERNAEPVVVDENFSPTGNVEHKPNGLFPHLNNWLYCAKDKFRYRWQDGKLLKDSTQFRGQWGITMDNTGHLYHNSNSIILRGERLLPETIESFPLSKIPNDTSDMLGSNAVFPIRVTPGVNRGYISIANGYNEDFIDPKTFKLVNTTASAGIDFYRGDQFPASWSDVAFTTESVVGLVKSTRVSENGLELTGEHVFPNTEFLASTDERFRPVNIHTAPDGSLYLVDYYHGIIQHKTFITSYLREQYESRNLQNESSGLGRIYRIRHKDKPLSPQPKLEEATITELIETLAHPNGWWRDTAQRLLVEKNDPESIAPLRSALIKHPNELTRIHALWTLAGLEKLTSEDFIAIFNLGVSEALRVQALSAAIALKQDDPLVIALVENSQKGEALEPYVLRYLAQTKPDSARLIQFNRKTPFAAEAIATGLLSQGITTFPKTGTNLDKYLYNVAKSKKSLTPEQRLKGEHLASFQRGKTLYTGAAGCIGCHGEEGEGMPNLGPPLDESEWVTGDPDRLAKILLHGLQGPITVNGIKYNPAAAMPGLSMNPTIKDKDIADIMTYIRGNWTNTAGIVTEKDVTTVHEATKDRSGRLYTAPELE